MGGGKRRRDKGHRATYLWSWVGAVACAQLWVRDRSLELPENFCGHNRKEEVLTEPPSGALERDGALSATL